MAETLVTVPSVYALSCAKAGTATSDNSMAKSHATWRFMCFSCGARKPLTQHSTRASGRIGHRRTQPWANSRFIGISPWRPERRPQPAAPRTPSMISAADILSARILVVDDDLDALRTLQQV